MGGCDGSHCEAPQDRRQCWNVGFRSPIEAWATTVKEIRMSSNDTQDRRKLDIAGGLVLISTWVKIDAGRWLSGHVVTWDPGDKVPTRACRRSQAGQEQVTCIGDLTRACSLEPETQSGE